MQPCLDEEVARGGLRCLWVRLGLACALGLLSVAAHALTATSLVFTASSTTPTTGQTVVLTATITPAAATGSITFMDGNGTSTLGTATLSGGVASFNKIFSGLGTHALSVTYAANATYASSSKTLSVVVNAPVALPTLPASPVPVVNYEYDAEGNPTKTIQAAGVSGFGFATSGHYDTLARLDTATDAKSGQTLFTYDGLDRLTQVKDPRMLLTQTPRNGLGDVTQLVSPDTGTSGNTYDAAGNLKTHTDARNVVATYSYDPLNRVQQVVYSGTGFTTLTNTWAYDQAGTGYSNGVGRLTSSAHASGSAQYAYDPQGRLVTDTERVTAQTGANPAAINSVIGYGYDAAGHVTSITYPTGRKLTVTYTGGLPTSMQLAKDGASTASTVVSQIKYAPFGGLQSWNLNATGALGQYRTYDTSGRIVRYTLGATVRDLTYDAAGRITNFTHYDAGTGATVPALDQGFGYDELGRLKTVSAGTSSWTIGYDANGNRTSVVLNGTTSTYTTPTTTNRLGSTTNPSRTFTYDLSGNTKADSVYSATYDAAGRLATTTKAGVTTTYNYDGSGRRVRKYSGTVASVKVFVYDQAGQLLGEYDSTGKALREYVWLGTTPIAAFTPDPAGATNPPLVYYFEADHLDTPRQVIDQAGNFRWKWFAEPFGTNAPDTNPQGLGAYTQPLRMPGQYADQETGLSYNYFRDYDASLGRYIESDPVGLAGGVNAYAYSLNEPTRYTDTLGLYPGDGPHAPSPAPPGPFDVLIPGTPANQQFANTAIRGIRAVVEACTPDNPCQPCKTVSGKVVPAGTIAYRPMDTPSKPEHGITGPHYNIYKANQNPKNCQCFWQSVGAVAPANLPPGAIPIEPFAN